MLRKRWRASLARTASSLAKGFAWGGLEVGEKNTWCLVIAVTIMGRGGAKRWGEV